ncbi:PHAF1 protein At3g51130 [Linum perenne]
MTSYRSVLQVAKETGKDFPTTTHLIKIKVEIPLAVRIPPAKQMMQQHHQRPRRRCEGTAMGAIVLDLRPGLGIGPFSLGMPICEAFAQIEQQPNLYDVVHVKYYDEEPLKLDIVISFPDHGFHLRFDPWSQRLRLVEIFDVKRLQMRYATSIIGGPSSLATFVAVYSLFGPTFPGIYDKDRGVYTLFYPGLSFAFPIPGQYADCCQDREAELPLEFPDGTTPVTCRVCVYDGSSDKKVGVGSLLDKAVTPPLPSGSLYMEEVQVKLREELFFSIGGQHIPFGASPQDVWTELGRPCGIHQKQTHKIKKFVLHSNYPGHADFNSYIKCNFIIQGNPRGLWSCSYPNTRFYKQPFRVHFCIWVSEHCLGGYEKWSYCHYHPLPVMNAQLEYEAGRDVCTVKN